MASTFTILSHKSSPLTQFISYTLGHSKLYSILFQYSINYPSHVGKTIHIATLLAASLPLTLTLRDGHAHTHPLTLSLSATSAPLINEDVNRWEGMTEPAAKPPCLGTPTNYDKPNSLCGNTEQRGCVLPFDAGHWYAKHYYCDKKFPLRTNKKFCHVVKTTNLLCNALRQM